MFRRGAPTGTSDRAHSIQRGSQTPETVGQSLPSGEYASRTEGFPAHVQIIQMGIAIWGARAVYAAARLGLADLLADGPRTAGELAASTGTHDRSLYRLLR